MQNYCTAPLPVRSVLVESHSNRSRFFLLPAVLRAFESARKLFCAGHRLGYEFCAAFRALHRGRTFVSRRFSLKFELFAGGILAALTLSRQTDTFRSEIESNDKPDPTHPQGNNPTVHLGLPPEKQPQSVHEPNHEKDCGSD